MILDFTKYNIAPNKVTPYDMLIYPGMQLEIFRDGSDINMRQPGIQQNFPQVIYFATTTEAKRFMRDVDIFLQYRTDELPEYFL